MEDPFESTKHSPIQDKFNVKLNVKLHNCTTAQLHNLMSRSAKNIVFHDW